jgi:uncharacterized protein DUF3631/DNA primase RepB-like protein/primase-like protein
MCNVEDTSAPVKEVDPNTTPGVEEIARPTERVVERLRQRSGVSKRRGARAAGVSAGSADRSIETASQTASQKGQEIQTLRGDPGSSGSSGNFLEGLRETYPSGRGQGEGAPPSSTYNGVESAITTAPIGGYDAGLPVEPEKAEFHQDRAEAARFLTMLDPTTEVFTFQTFGEGEAAGTLASVFHGTLDQLWDTLVALNRRGAGIYVTVNATDLKGRKVENITRVRAVWQDDDTSRGWDVPLEPSMVVNTSPRKFQRYLLTDDLAREEHRALMDVMVEKHGADKNAIDLARVLRLPGFYHMKERHKRHLVRIVSGVGHRYTGDEIRAALPPPPKEQREHVTTGASHTQPVALGDDEVARYKSAAEFLHHATNGADFHDRDTWRDHGFALHHATKGGEQGFVLWSEVSELYAPTRYDPKDQRKTWDGFNGENDRDADRLLKLGTIYKRARDLGWKTDEEQEQEAVDREVERLAGLSAALYDRRRNTVAKQLGIRASTLDDMVRRKRDEQKGSDHGGILFAEDEDWPEPVDGAELLAELVAVLRRYVVLPDHAAVAIALWCIFTHAHDAKPVSPLLAIQSPVKRCGKSTLLFLIAKLVFKGLVTSNTTPAGIFRLVDMFALTLLFDEADTFVTDEHSELRGLLNSGHTRDGATVIRCVGDEHDVKVFKTWCPKAVAGIGTLPDTLQDRSIVVAMRRKGPDDPEVQSLRLDKTDHLAQLRRKATRWAKDNLENVRQREPDVPRELNDRAKDNWRPLLAIVEVAGGDWPKRARQAAIELSAANEKATVDYRIELLRDIRGVFDSQAAIAVFKPEITADRILSSNLAEQLAKLESGRWARWGREGKPITANAVTRTLKYFDIEPRRPDAGSTFFRADFEDAWKRYVDTTDDQVAPATQAEGNGRRAAQDPSETPSKKLPEVPELPAEAEKHSSTGGLEAGSSANETVRKVPAGHSQTPSPPLEASAEMPASSLAEATRRPRAPILAGPAALDAWLAAQKRRAVRR